MKVIIAGSRDFTDYALLQKKCDAILAKCTDITIISGTARGADKLGERYAKERGYKLEQFPANWDAYGTSAGYKRNEQMILEGHANGVILFWDGKSRGTMHMRDLAIKHAVPFRVIQYNTQQNKEKNNA